MTSKCLITHSLASLKPLNQTMMSREGSGRISERDLCNFLLKNSKIPPKKQVHTMKCRLCIYNLNDQATMLKRVEKKWPSKGRGISLPSFGYYPLLQISIIPPAGTFSMCWPLGPSWRELSSSWMLRTLVSTWRSSGKCPPGSHNR